MGESIGPILGGVGGLLGGAASASSIFSGKADREKDTRALRDLIGRTTSDATGILTQTSPLRSLSVANLAAVLGGGRTENLRVFAPERETVEQQFRRADENLVAGGVRGGALDRSRADLNIARAQTLGGMESDVRKRAFEDALRIGFGAAPSVAFPAFAGSANALSNLAAAGGARESAGGAGLGSLAGIGALLALKQGKK